MGAFAGDLSMAIVLPGSQVLPLRIEGVMRAAGVCDVMKVSFVRSKLVGLESNSELEFPIS
jgi:hypothetical protein